MSLTPNELRKIWDCIDSIDARVKQVSYSDVYEDIVDEIKIIKNLIEREVPELKEMK